MAPVIKKLIMDDGGLAAVEKVGNINTKRKKPRKMKSCVFVPLVKSNESAEDRPKSKPIVRPVKNLILVEGNSPDTGEVPKKREMRSFPIEECLSAKIRIANGTDYSNHFIEQHYKRKCKKDSKNSGAMGSSKKKKLFSNRLKSDVEIVELIENIIDVSSDSSEEIEIIEEINNIKNNHKFNSESNKIEVRPKLVPYSSSEDETSDEDTNGDNSCIEISSGENDSIGKSRMELIHEGLNEEKFKFE